MAARHTYNATSVSKITNSMGSWRLSQRMAIESHSSAMDADLHPTLHIGCTIEWLVQHAWEWCTAFSDCHGLLDCSSMDTMCFSTWEWTNRSRKEAREMRWHTKKACWPRQNGLMCIRNLQSIEKGKRQLLAQQHRRKAPPPSQAFAHYSSEL
jgi:hypothetical protein